MNTDRERALDRAMEAPLLVADPEQIANRPPLDYGLAGSIATTPGGRLWVSSVGGGDDYNAFTVGRFSDDAGRTWSEPQLLVNPDNGDDPLRTRSLLATFWTDPRGRLWLFVDQSITYFDGRAGTWAAHSDDPDAEHPTWSKPERVSDGGALNKPIVLADGTWLLAVSLWDRTRIESPTRGLRETWPPNPYAGAFDELDDDRGVQLIASTDEGATWRRRGVVRIDPPEFDEPRLIQRLDGSIWLTARAAVGGMHESFSTDGGRTWSTPSESALRHTSSRHELVRLASGRLLLVKHGIGSAVLPTDGARTDLCAFLSDDDGQSWSDPLLLDDRTKVSYPDSTQLPDGTICVTYDLNRNTEGRIFIVRFSERDVLAGGTVSDRSLVSEPDPIAMQRRIQRDIQRGEWAPNRDAAAV